MSGEFHLHPPIVRALKDYVTSIYAEKDRSVGRRLFEKKTVRNLRLDDFRISGQVETVAEAVLEYSKARQRIDGSCSCEGGFDCPHCFALAFQALAFFENGKTPALDEPAAPAKRRSSVIPRSESQWMEQWRKKTNTPIDPSQRRLFSAAFDLHRQWTRDTDGFYSILCDAAARRLTLPSPPGGEQFLPPFQLDDTRHPDDFLQTLLAALDYRGFRLEESWRKLMDPEAARAQHEAWRVLERKNWLRQWDRQLQEADRRPPGATAVRDTFAWSNEWDDVRARLIPLGMVFECRRKFDGEWGSLLMKSLGKMVAQPVTDIPIQDPFWRKMFPLLVVLQKVHFTSRLTLEMRRLVVRELLGKGLLCADNGTPLPHPLPKARWVIEPAPEGLRERYQAVLVDEAGVAVEVKEVFPEAPVLLLAEDRLFEAPPNFIPAHSTYQPALVPAEILTQATPLRRLREMGVGMPAEIEQRISWQPLPVHLKIELANDLWRETHALQATLQAANDFYTYVFTAEGWVEKRAALPPPAEGPWALPDLSLALRTSALWPNLPWRFNGAHWQATADEHFWDALPQWLDSLPRDLILEVSDNLAGLQNPVELELTAQVEDAEERDWFDLKLQYHASDLKLSREEKELLIKAEGRFVHLPKHGWRRAVVRKSEDTRQTMDALGVVGLEDAQEWQMRLHPLQLEGTELALQMTPQLRQRVENTLSRIRAWTPPPPPASLQAQLRPYQTEGFQFLCFLSSLQLGGVLADDMGLGKTVQALAWMAWIAENNEAASPTRHLVVCPKSVVGNWVAECRRFLPSWKVASGAGSWEAQEGLAIVNYSQLRNWQTELTALAWDTAILDEGQYIKNPNSQTAQAARALPARGRVVLTGTPVENRLLDLWSLFAFAQKGFLGSRAEFTRTYEKRGSEKAASLEVLRRRTRRFLLRRTKSQVALDLPPRTEEEISCELEGEQKSLYEAEIKNARAILLSLQSNEELARERFHVLTSLLRLRQICCDPALLLKNFAGSSAKREALLEKLESLREEGHKSLVFSQFTEMLDLLAASIRQRQWSFRMLTGKTENRAELVEAFQNSPDPEIFLISLKAGGTGLNLTAASYVFLYDPWWNPAVENQAIDRTHRIGQTSPVFAYRLIAKDTIEEKIRQLQAEKSALAQVASGEDNLAEVLNLADLQKLLGETATSRQHPGAAG